MWPFVKISKICTRTATRDPRQTPEDYFKYIDISSVDREQKRIVSTSEIIGSEAPSRARKEVKSGDILVSTVRPNLNAVALLPQELDNQIASTGFCILRPQMQIDNNYLFYFTISTQFIEELTAKVKGAHYPAVSDSDVKNVKIPLPPLSEQRRIVEVLDQADRLRKLRAEADKKAERILPALFINMFGDPLLNQKGFAIEPMGELLTLVRNGTTADQNTDGRGYPVTRIETISDGVINPEKVRYVQLSVNELKKWKIEIGDILFSHINSETHIGKTAIYTGHPNPLIHGMNLLLMRPNKTKVFPEYLFAMLNMESVRSSYRQRCKRAVNQASLNQNDIKTLEVPLASKEKQEVFCRLVSGLILPKESQIKAKEKIQVLFETILHRAFTGDLTASWRQAHMKELLQEMEIQAKALNN